MDRRFRGNQHHSSLDDGDEPEIQLEFMLTDANAPAFVCAVATSSKALEIALMTTQSWAVGQFESKHVGAGAPTYQF